MKFTFENAVAQAFVVWMGGFETSAITMQFALYEMSLNQEIQEKAREEILKIAKKFDGKITYEGLSKMEYLGKVVDGICFFL